MIKNIILALLLASLLLGAYYIGTHGSNRANVTIDYLGWSKLVILAALVLVFYLKEFKITINVSVPEKAIKVFVDINKIESLGSGDGSSHRQNDMQIIKPNINPWGDIKVGESNLMEVS